MSLLCRCPNVKVNAQGEKMQTVIIGTNKSICAAAEDGSTNGSRAKAGRFILPV
jgi:hypothetical protein